MTLARWILHAATHNPPEALRDWAMAMRREYDEVGGGEFGWALGCAGAMATARLRVEWLYWVLIAATPVLLWFAGRIQVHEWFFDGGGTPQEMHRAGAFEATFAAFSPLPFAILIGWYRPNRALTTMLAGGLLFHQIGTTLYASWLMNTNPLSWWGLSATVYMGPPLIGLSASLAVWYLGAKLGAGLRPAPA